MKKALSFVLAFVFVVGICASAPVTITANAASVGDLTFELNEDGESYYVKDCSDDASGELVIPSTYNGAPVTKIGDEAFYYCSSLTSVTIPESVTSMGTWAFSGCDSLTSVNITDIASWCNIDFGYDSNPLCNGVDLYLNGELVTELTIPEGVTEIKDFAFSGCTSLTSITIPDSVTSIGEVAFYDCTSLTSVNITDIASWCNIDLGYDSNPLCNGASLYLNGELVTELTIPESVTKIKDYALDGCTSLKSITIPDSVTSIGRSAFWGCTSLTSITIPDSVTSIGECAFFDCTSLASVTIPESVTSIDEDAFYNCTSLTSVYITDIASWCNIEFAGYFANPLYNEKNLYLNGELVAELTIPEGVTEIKDYAFNGCTSLTSITISDSVTSIGCSAFEDCFSLTSVTIPGSVTSIGNDAFIDCASLTSVTISDGVNHIGDLAFYDCTSLTSITIPDSVTSIGDWAFVGCTSLASINVSDGNESFASIDGVLFTKDKETLLVYPRGKCVTLYTVPDGTKVIGEEAFYKCLNLDRISFGNTLEKISDRAFYRCYTLTSIIIPDSVKEIGRSAFYDCYNLDEVIIKGDPTIRDSSAFEKTSYYISYYNNEENWENGALYLGNNLIEAKDDITGLYTIKEGTINIANHAFSDCSSLTGVTIPDTVVSIGDYAFYYCTSFIDITIPNSVTSIGDSAFYGCKSLSSVHITNLASWCNIDFDYDYDANPLCNGADLYLNGELVTELTIPESVTEINDYAFSGCTSLTSITIPDSVTSIGEKAFSGCSSLKTIALPERLDSIGYAAFVDCTSLLSVKIPYGVTSIPGCAFKGCASLANVVIPETVTTIEFSAFENCTALSALTIPESVNSIEADGFFGCESLRTVVIPSGVTKISSNSFGECKSLQSVTIPNGVTSIAYHAFVDCTALKSVEIPKSVESIGEYGFGYKRDRITEGDWYVYSKIDDFTIYGVRYSEAEVYANENGFTFVDVTAHTHSYTETEFVQPDCVNAGYKTFTCSCGVSYKEPVAALGHDYSNEYTVDKIPTYDSEGSESRHCTRCGAKTGVRAIPKLVKFPAPTILTMTSTEKGVKFTWSAVDGVEGFIVFKLYEDGAGGYVYKELAVVAASTLAFTDWTAVDGEKYCYAVASMDKYGNASAYSEFAFTYVKPIPLATPVVKTANTAKGIKVTWNKVANAQKYVVYRKFYSPKNKKWSGWIALNSNCKATSFVDTTTKIGINYRYTVKAVNGKSASAFKSTPTIKYNVTPVVKVANASNGIKVSWSTVANATGYTVYSSTYNTKTEKWSSWKNRGTAGKNKTSWVDKKAKPGTVYKYTVRAVCGSNASSFKASSSLVRLLNPTVKVAKASNGVKVAWNKIAGAKNYKIYRAQYVNGKWSGWSAIKTTNNKTFAYVDKTAKKGITYKYTVRAVNGKSASAFTASRNVKR